MTLFDLTYKIAAQRQATLTERAGGHDDEPLVEKLGARHTKKEMAAINRIIELAQTLGGGADIERAGRRHSARDQAAIQEIHDIAKGDLGAACKADYPTKRRRGGTAIIPLPMRQKSELVERGQRDAPNYRPTSTPQACENCAHRDKRRSDLWCDLFDFVAERGYTCDRWEPPGQGQERQIPGYKRQAALANAAKQVTRRD